MNPLRMTRMLGLVILVVAFVVLALSGCGATPTPAPVPKPTATPFPQAFVSQMQSFLGKGIRLGTMSEQGLTYAEMRQETANVKTAYQIVSPTWPIGFCPGARTNAYYAV
jgi:hypothetical protein